MALKKYSAFIYGHTINSNNRFLNFGESYLDPDQRTAILDIGSYTISQMAGKIAEALNAAGNQEYTVTLDRNTRRFTISAPNPFELLVSSGNQAGVSVFSLIGFTGNVDLITQTAYSSDDPSGSMYITQTPLANFSDFDKNREKAEASVKTTPSGITEVVAYSTLERAKMDFPLITNYTPQRYIRETNTGVEEALDFLNYAINKAPMEFLYEFDQPNNYIPVILDKTARSRSGTGFELRERVRDSLPGYFDIKGLVFLKIEE